ncbi:LOW QUALITY PROTEIN: hypothetical protein RJ640_008821 [Escallonia rubra]|uniref:Uncharacterized protein n=1 Tax=Escallonia rubra TaxID=112253 RepID=A0AA88R8I7_9ASTE|nr:LOW QUALITY PROTEIN: hypothetical protein RJ640_008821 [Escallonia rubra]
MALSASHHFFFFLLFSLALVSVLLALPHPAVAQCKNPPVIFNFGDSNSDTGGLVAGLGFPVNLPNGRTFFGRSTGRLCDGRLVIDFLCQSVNTSFLSPYMESLGSTFSNGANFAVVGSSTLPKYVPFALNVMQFLHFKSRSLELVTAGSGKSISDEEFRGALYMVDIGQNDLADSFAKNLSYVQVIKLIPSVLAEIKNAITVLYNQGGRKFWVHNTGPFGCSPQKLSLVQNHSQNLDTYGCISSYNAAAKVFNEGLLHICQEMRSEMKDATIVYVDIYSIKYDLIANSSRYGFSSPLSACCGFGGPPYNYNIKVPCGQPACQVCNEGSPSISWDGVHYTEAANTIISSKVLSMAYSTPRIAFDFFCR